MAKPAKKKGRVINRLFGFFAKILFFLFFLSLIQVFILRFINPPFTMSTLALRAGNLFSSRHYTVPKDEWRPIRDISPFLLRAVLASEDQRFMSHHGFDFREVGNALKDILEDRKVRGASTITMQMARTVFLWNGRSVVRKLAEAYYTMLIEFIMPKIRILELYLNTVDWGNGVMGAEAASRKYFDKSASELTAGEAALLAAVLPSPHKWSPVKPDKQVLIRQKRILKSMDRMHL